ncbi:1-acyl-sn-glycerol-3-phosphate acyltransferase, partial [Vibrio sinaloensis]
FGDVIDQTYDTPEALAEEIDRQIHLHYKLFPINQLAAGNEDVDQSVKQSLKDKLVQLPEAAQPYLIASYANPVNNQN